MVHRRAGDVEDRLGWAPEPLPATADQGPGRGQDTAGVDKGQLTRSSFIREMGADSLHVVELVMELEEEFGVTLPDD
jgi:hypothetical protein